MSYPILKVTFADGRTVDVQTALADIVRVESSTGKSQSAWQPDSLEYLARITHNALRRTGADAPAEFDAFLDSIDDIDPVAPEGKG